MEWDKFDPIGVDLLFKSCTITSDMLNRAKSIAYAIIVGEDQYVEVSKVVNAPWFVIGAIHQMECGGSFDHHLHNGDHLKARTVHVPVGRPVADPKSGKFPYEWVESACDAIGIYPPRPPSWDAGHALIFLEMYNGLGYREEKKPSPYIWSGTNNYQRGKFTADGKYDASAKSEQVGCAAMLKLLNDWKTIDLN